MYYLQSRYYDPETGRFINCDDVNYIGVTESAISYNPFAYCENSPVNCVDVMGTFGYEMHFTQTKKWAEQFLSTSLFSKSMIKNIAYYLAAWDVAVDEEKRTSPTADPLNHWAQSWHFNINSNKKGATDSRLLRYREKVKEADQCMKTSYKFYKKKGLSIGKNMVYVFSICYGYGSSSKTRYGCTFRKIWKYSCVGWGYLFLYAWDWH
ncbi:MAG: RHS repeat-associated core domain-containing protein [Acutalibacteraceae bacterium]